MVRTILTSEHRAKMECFLQAKTTEIEGLGVQNVWEKVNETELPLNANIVGGRFVLSLKNFSISEKNCKCSLHFPRLKRQPETYSGTRRSRTPSDIHKNRFVDYHHLEMTYLFSRHNTSIFALKRKTILPRVDLLMRIGQNSTRCR